MMSSLVGAGAGGGVERAEALTYPREMRGILQLKKGSGAAQRCA